MNKFWLKYSIPVFQMPDGGSGGGDNGAGASSHPASSPAPAPSSASTPAAHESTSPSGADGAGGMSTPEIDFGFIFGDGEESDTGQEAPRMPPAAAKPQPQDPKTPAAASPPAASQVPEVVVAPAATPAPAATDTPSTPGAQAPAQIDPYDPVALASALMQNEVQAVQHVASSMFKLTPEELEGLESNPSETIPLLLAKGFVRSQHNMLQQIGRILPGMMQKLAKAQKVNSDNEAQFFARWPELNSAQHGEMVRQMAVTYRQMHPGITREQMIEDLGPFVMMRMGVKPGAPQPQGTPVARSPMAPTGARVQVSPFQPAGPVSGGASPTPLEQMHPAAAVLSGMFEEPQ